MKKIFRIMAVVMLIAMCVALCSCTAAGNVNYNVSQAADNFQVLRKVTVYNARTDLIVMEMEGYMSISNSATNELVVTCKVGADTYKKNYVYLNEYVIYVVEDISGSVTDPYHYNVKFYTAVPDIDINH